MSTTAPEQVVCPACQHEQTVLLVQSANVQRAPAWRTQVLDHTLMRFTCQQCAAPIVVERELLYTDLDRQLFIGVFPRVDRARADELAAMIERAFQQTFFIEAPAVVRRQADQVRRRVVFGYQELREKLVCFEAGLDDRLLEALKLGLLGSRPGWAALGPPVLDGLEDDGRLRFVHVRRPPGTGTELSHVARPAYDALAADTDRVAVLLEPLFSGCYVNLERCLRGTAEQAS